MRVVIAAGGTGGHIYPGIAIAECLKDRDPEGEILFIGSYEGLEEDLVRREGFEIRLIPARALLRKISYKALSAPFISLWGFFKALSILRSFNPNIVVVTGGYVSFPVIAAAKSLGIPILLHEQNTLPGFTNRFWAPWVKVVTLSFEESQKYLKGTVTGNPVRKRILNARRQTPSRPTVLVLGGSQGARSINYALLAQLPDLSDFEIYHVIGDRDFKCLDIPQYPFYHPASYVYNIEEELARADLLVSRAGATAIFEILAVGRPSILIPFPYSAEGHQDLNAKVLAAAGAAVVLKDSELTRLGSVIKELLNNKKKMEEMGRAAYSLAKPQAAAKIVDLIYAVS